MTDVLEDYATAMANAERVEAQNQELRREIDRLTANGESLRTRLDEVVEGNNELRRRISDNEVNALQVIEDVRARWRTQVTRIGEAFKAAADDDSDVAEYYDEIVARLNPDLTYELPSRKREYTVEVNYNLRFTVEATDEDGARDEVEDSVRAFENLIDGYTGAEYSAVSTVEYRYDWDINEA
jgi:chromosome segregation ATPase